MTYFVLYMAHHPSVQRKLHAEVDSVIGDSRQVNLEDRQSLPYVTAFISEVQRHAAVVPFSVRHASLQVRAYA